MEQEKANENTHPPTIEERRLQLDEERLKIEIARSERESGFFKDNATAIITGLVTLFVAAVSYYQYTKNEENEIVKTKNEITKTQNQKDKDHNDNTLRLDDQRLKVLQYLTEHKDEIFSSKSEVQRIYRALMLSALPRDSLNSVFDQLHQLAGPNDKMWTMGNIGYEWVSVGIGDCTGRDVGSTLATSAPDVLRCSANFEGRVAVCWDGNKFMNGVGAWCTYKEATPQTCVGGGRPGQMYQCALSVMP